MGLTLSDASHELHHPHRFSSASQKNPFKLMKLLLMNFTVRINRNIVVKIIFTYF